MLKAETIIQGINLGSRELAWALHAGGYDGDRVSERKFIGIANGAEFVYTINFPWDDAPEGVGTAVIFVTWDEGKKKFIADY